MSYINKRVRAFNKGPSDEVVSIRSEGRMKNYPSALDIRAWSDTVEERRQHILEYIAKNKRGLCPDKLIPLDVLIDAMMTQKNARIKKLEKRIDYLEKLLDLYSQLDLTAEQKQKLDKLKKDIEEAYAELDFLKSERNDLETVYDRRKRKSDLLSSGKPKKRDKKKEETEGVDSPKKAQRKKKARVLARDIPDTSGDEQISPPKKYRGKRKSEKSDISQSEKPTDFTEEQEMLLNESKSVPPTTNDSTGKKKKGSATIIEERKAKNTITKPVSVPSGEYPPTQEATFERKMRSVIPRKKPISDTEYELHPEKSQRKGESFPEHKGRTDMTSRPRSGSPRSSEQNTKELKKEIPKASLPRKVEKSSTGHEKLKDDVRNERSIKSKPMIITQEKMETSTGGDKTITGSKTDQEKKHPQEKTTKSKQHEAKDIPQKTSFPKAKTKSSIQNKDEDSEVEEPVVRVEHDDEVPAEDIVKKEKKDEFVKKQKSETPLQISEEQRERKTKKEKEKPQGESTVSGSGEEKIDGTKIGKSALKEEKGSKASTPKYETASQDESKEKPQKPTKTIMDASDNVKSIKKIIKPKNEKIVIGGISAGETFQEISEPSAVRRLVKKPGKEEPTEDDKSNEVKKVFEKAKDSDNLAIEPISDQKTKRRKSTTGILEEKDRPDMKKLSGISGVQQKIIPQVENDESGHKMKEPTRNVVDSKSEGTKDKLKRHPDLVKGKPLDSGKYKRKKDGTPVDSLGRSRDDKTGNVRTESKEKDSDSEEVLKEEKPIKPVREDDEKKRAVEPKTEKDISENLPDERLYEIDESNESEIVESRQITDGIPESAEKIIDDEEKAEIGKLEPVKIDRRPVQEKRSIEVKKPQEISMAEKILQNNDEDSEVEEPVVRVEHDYEVPSEDIVKKEKRDEFGNKQKSETPLQISEEQRERKTKKEKEKPQGESTVSGSGEKKIDGTKIGKSALKEEKGSKASTSKYETASQDESKEKPQKPTKTIMDTSDNVKSIKKIIKPRNEKIVNDGISAGETFQEVSEPPAVRRLVNKPGKEEPTEDDKSNEVKKVFEKAKDSDNPAIEPISDQKTKRRKSTTGILEEKDRPDIKKLSGISGIPVDSLGRSRDDKTGNVRPESKEKDSDSEDVLEKEKPIKPVREDDEKKRAIEPKTEKNISENLPDERLYEIDESNESKIVESRQITDGIPESAEKIIDDEEKAEIGKLEPVKIDRRPVQEKPSMEVKKPQEISIAEKILPEKIEKAEDISEKEVMQRKPDIIELARKQQMLKDSEKPTTVIETKVVPTETREEPKIIEKQTPKDVGEEPTTLMETKLIPETQKLPGDSEKEEVSKHMKSVESQEIKESRQDEKVTVLGDEDIRISEKKKIDGKAGELLDKIKSKISKKITKPKRIVEGGEKLENDIKLVPYEESDEETELVEIEFGKKKGSDIQSAKTEPSETSSEFEIPKHLSEREIMERPIEEPVAVSSESGKGVTESLIKSKDTSFEDEITEELEKVNREQKPEEEVKPIQEPEIEQPPEIVESAKERGLEVEDQKAEIKSIEILDEPIKEKLEDLLVKSEDEEKKPIQEPEIGEPLKIVESAKERGLEVEDQKAEIKSIEILDEPMKEKLEDLLVKSEDEEEKPIQEPEIGEPLKIIESAEERGREVEDQKAEIEGIEIIDEPIKEKLEDLVVKSEMIVSEGLEEKVSVKVDIPKDQLDHAWEVDQQKRKIEGDLRPREEFKKDVQTQQFEHRCAALIRHAKERCAALASRSGGIVALPDSKKGKRDLIPTGYWPGEVLQELPPPQSTSGDIVETGIALSEGKIIQSGVQQNGGIKCQALCSKTIHQPREKLKIHLEEQDNADVLASRDDSPDRDNRIISLVVPPDIDADGLTDIETEPPVFGPKPIEGRPTENLRGRKYVPKLELAWEEVDIEDLIEDVDELAGKALIGNRISRVLSGDTSGLGTVTFPVNFKGSKTLSGEILQRRFSDKVLRKKSSEMTPETIGIRASEQQLPEAGKLIKQGVQHPCSALITRQQFSPRDNELLLVEKQREKDGGACDATRAEKNKLGKEEEKESHMRTTPVEDLQREEVIESSTLEKLMRDVSEPEAVIKLFERDLQVDRDVTSERHIQESISDEIKSHLERVLQSLDDKLTSEVEEENKLIDEIEKSIPDVSQYEDIDQNELDRSQLMTMDSYHTVTPIQEEDAFVSAIDTSTMNEERISEEIPGKKTILPFDKYQLRRSKEDIDITSSIAKIDIYIEKQSSIIDPSPMEELHSVEEITPVEIPDVEGGEDEFQYGAESRLPIEDVMIGADFEVSDVPDTDELISSIETCTTEYVAVVDEATSEVESVQESIIVKHISIVEEANTMDDVSLAETIDTQNFDEAVIVGEIIENIVVQVNEAITGIDHPPLLIPPLVKDNMLKYLASGGTVMENFNESEIDDSIQTECLIELYHGVYECYTPRAQSLKDSAELADIQKDKSIVLDSSCQVISKDSIPRATTVETTTITDNILNEVIGVNEVPTPGEINRLLNDRFSPLPNVPPSSLLPVPQPPPATALPQTVPIEFTAVPRAVMPEFVPTPVSISRGFFPRLFGTKRSSLKRDSVSQTEDRLKHIKTVGTVCLKTGLVCDCCKKAVAVTQAVCKGICADIKNEPKKDVCRGPCAKPVKNTHIRSVVRRGGEDKEDFDRNQDGLEKLKLSVTPKDSKEDLPTIIIHKDADIIALRNALVAKESYCAEQRKIAAAALEQLENIKNIVEERDDLRKKLETSQDELEELKRNIALGYPFGISETRPYMPTSFGGCEEEITALENEINDMRSGKLTPNLEAQVIRKEVEVLKKYCSKLSVIQKENHHLKNEIAKYEDKLNMLGCLGDDDRIEVLKEKLDTLNETVKERDELKCKLNKLEKELMSYNDLPEDIEVFKQRSLLLDEVLQDRDRLSKRVEQLRGVDEEIYNLRKKCSRIDELEEKLKRLSKDKKSQEEELEHLRCKCSLAEIDALNQKAEGDTLKSKIICLEHEVESMKCLCKDKERLKQERDDLQRSLDELVRMQNNFDYMKNQMKCLDMLKKEKDVYKTKYENLMGLECECDILRAQVERAKVIEKERNALENQVEDLETCIADQENEIRRLVCHIDILAKGRDEQQEKLKDVLCTMRNELDKKDHIIKSSEKKLSLVQKELITSIQGLSSETTNLKSKNDTLGKCICNLQNDRTKLEKEKEDLKNSLSQLQKEKSGFEEDKTNLQTCLCNLEMTVESSSGVQSSMKAQIAKMKRNAEGLNKQIKELTSDNEFLIENLQEREAYIKSLQDVLKDHEPMLQNLEILKQTARADSDKYELEAAKFQQQPHNSTGDEHLHELLRQSKHAVQRIALELCKQYEEWDCVKNKLKQIKKVDQFKERRRRCTCCTCCTCCTSSRPMNNSTQDRSGNDKSVTAKMMDSSATQDDGVVKDNKAVSAIGLENAETQYKKKQGIATEDHTKWDCYKKRYEEKEYNDSRSPCVCKSVGITAEECEQWKCQAMIGTTKLDKKIGEVCEYASTGTDYYLDECSATRRQDAASREMSFKPCECKKNIQEAKLKTEMNDGGNKGGNTDETSQDHSSGIYNASETSRDDTDKYEYDVTKWSCKTTVKSDPRDDSRRYEFDVSKWSCNRPKLEEHKIEEETEDEMHTARSNEDKCKHLEDRIEILERELAQANETVLKLQEKLAGTDRTVAENQALRRHSSEVQEVAKDQIEDLVEHLKRAKERAAFLEEENEKLSNLLKNMQLEKDEFMKIIKGLQEEIEKGAGDIDVVSKLRKELEDCLNEKSILQEQIVMLEKQLSDNVPEDEKLRDLLAANKKLKERLEHELNLKQQLEVEKEDLKKHIAELEKGFSERSDIEELKRQLQEAEDNIKNEIEARLKAENKNAELLKAGDGSEMDELRLKELEELRKQLKDALANLKRETEEKQNAENKFTELEDLMKKLHDAEDKVKSTGDTGEVERLRKELDDEKNKSKNVDDLMSQIQKLKKEKADLEKMLASNVLTTSRRSSVMENEIIAVAKKNKELQDKNIRMRHFENDKRDLSQELASCKDENKRLKDELDKAKSELDKLNKQKPDSDIIDALRKENENLLKKLEAQAKEIGDLLDKMRTPKPVVEISKSQLDRDIREKQTLQSIIADLENQLKNVSRDDRKVQPILPSDDLQNMITNLTKRLEDEQARADAAELALRNMRTSDPSAMLKSAIAKLEKQLTEIEGENTKLKQQLAQSTNEATTLKKDLDAALNEAKKINEDNAQLKQYISNLQKENSDLKSSIDKLKSGLSGDDFLKSEIKKLKDQIAQLEKDKASLKNEVAQKDNEIKNAYNKITKLQNEIGELKQNQVKLQSDNDKMKKDLDNALNNAGKDGAKISQLENDNNKLKKDVQNLEGELAKVKRDLDSALNAAKKGTSGVSDLQDEIMKLKQKCNQLEVENANLKRDLNAALDNSKSTAAKIAQLTDEVDKLKNAKDAAESKLEKLQKDLDSANADAKKSASNLERQQNDIAGMKEKLLKLEAENTKLKKDLKAALDDSKKGPIFMDQDANLKQKLAQLENENSKLKKDLEKTLDEAKKTPGLDKLKDEENKLREKLGKLEAENSKLNKDLSAALGKLNEASDTISQLKDSQNKWKEKLSSLESDNAQLKKDLNKSLDDAKKYVSEISNLRDSESKLKQRIAHLESENTKLKTNLDAALDGVKNNLNIMQSLKDDNNKLTQKVAQLEQENSILKKNLEAALKDKKLPIPVEDNEKLKSQLSQLENANGKLKKELDNVLEDHKKCSKIISQLQDEIERLKKQIAELEKDGSKLKRQYEGAMGDMKTNNDELNKLKESESKLKQLLAKVQTDNDKLNKDVIALTAELKTTEGNLVLAKNEAAKSKQRISLLEDENAQLKNNLGGILDELKKVKNALSQLQEENPKLKQRIAQLETENAKLKKELDAAIADAKKGSAGADQMRSEDTKLRNLLAQLEKDNKKLKADLNTALDQAKKSVADVTKMRDDDSKQKQQIAKLENENAKLKKDLEKAINDALANSSGAQGLRDENNKLKQKINQLEEEIAKLKADLNAALENAKKGASGLSQMQADDAKLKQRISQLDKDNAKLKSDLEAALNEARAGNDTGSKLRNDNAKQKQMIGQLEDEIAKLKKNLENALNDTKKGDSGLQDENAKLKQKIVQLEKDNATLKKSLDDVSTNAKAASTANALLTDENNKLKQKVKQLQGDLDQLRKDLNTALDDKKKALANLSSVRDGETRLKKRIAEIESDNVKLKQDLDTAFGNAKSGKGDLNKIRDENASMRQRIVQLEGDNSKLKKELDDALSDTKNRAGEVLRLKDENAKLKQKIADLEISNSKLKKELDSALSHSKNAANELVKLNEEIAKLKEASAQKDSELNDLKKKLDIRKDKDSTIAELSNENNKLKGRIRDLENQLAKLGDELAKLKRELSQKDGQINELKENLERTIAGNKDKDAKIKGLENNLVQHDSLDDSLAKLKQEMGLRDKQVNDLKNRLEKLMNDNKNKDANINELANENEKLKARLKDLENQLGKLNDGIKIANDTAKKAAEDFSKMRGDYNKLKTDNEMLMAKNKLKADEIKEYEAKIKQLQVELSRQKKECTDNIASMKEQFDRDMKDLLKKNEASIAKLQKAHEEFLKQLNESHDNDIESLQKALRKAKTDLDEITKERDRLKSLLDVQRRKSIEIKDKVEQVESIVKKERKKSKEESQKSKDLEGKLDAEIKRSKDLESMSYILKKESEELAKEKESMQEKAHKLEKEKEHLERSSMEIQKAFEDEKRKSIEISKELENLNKKISEISTPTEKKAKHTIEPVPIDKPKEPMKIQTFKTFSTDAAMPDVIAITTPLSDKELKFFGKTSCSCEPNLATVMEKLAKFGMDGLGIEELQLLHTKICDATVNVLAKIGQSSGVLKPNENDKLGLLRRIASLEGDLLKKQKHAQQKVIAMQYAVKLEKERLSDLRKSLDEEKLKNSELLSQIGSQSKVVSNIQEERDLIQRQKSYHEQKLEQYLIAVEEERGKSRNLEDELEKEKSNNQHLKSLLEAERNRSRQNKRKDTEALETMRIKLEKTVNSEMMLRMKLQEKTCRRHPSPHTITPVRDGQQIRHPQQSSSRTRSAFYTDLSPGDGASRPYTKRTFSNHSGGQSGSSNGLDLEDK